MFDEIKERLTPKIKKVTPEQEITNAYRRTFESLEGRLVLAHLLTDLGVFNELEPTDEEVANHNAGIRILARLGIIKAENIQAIIDSLMKINVT